MAYNNMAICQSDAGDYYGSQERLLSSLRYLHEGKERDQWCLIADYNELGTDNLNLKNYDAAIANYDRAAGLAKDEASKAIALNNKALSYEKKGQYAEAISIYESILTQSKKNKRQYARVLTNLAMARWRQDSSYRAAPDLLYALQMRRSEKDDWGLNSSYSHLADYYTASRPDSALGYAREMYAMASRLRSPDDEVEALRKLVLLGPPKEVKAYFSRYQQLQDSLETTRGSAKNQYALILYEAEKSKADILRLQRENAEKRLEVTKQRAVSFGVSVIFILVLWWGIGWYRRRKQQIQRDAEGAIRESRLRTSQKVHDVVANGLYRLMNEIQYGEQMGEEQLMDKIDALYKQSRDISYEQASDSTDFQAVVEKLLLPFGKANTRVLLIGNDNGLWADLADKTKRELEPVLLELMVNMEKHSSASNVIVRFDRGDEWIAVRYSDDGIGLGSDHRQGNGLKNTENRIRGLGGRIIFEENSPTGLNVRIYLPTGDPA